jgi:hypothetical protein
MFVSCLCISVEFCISLRGHFVISSKLANSVLHALFITQYVLNKMFTDGLNIVPLHRAHVRVILVTLVRNVLPYLPQFS